MPLPSHSKNAQFVPLLQSWKQVSRFKKAFSHALKEYFKKSFYDQKVCCFPLKKSGKVVRALGVKQTGGGHTVASLRHARGKGEN